ncbi:MAG: class I adenylate-forming enzyme family protein [Christensenellaceae bacterium]|jgi:AMP-dependent synthetase/ligase|nr:MAG: hypothetical protein DBY05_03910 [Clostridiales bacterium]
MKPSNRLLYEYFEEYASERGNDTFLFDEKICYTVARAFNIAKSLARQLQNAGIKRGDFVAIKAERTPRTILLFYALQFIGGVAVLRDPHENTDDKIRIIDDRLSLGKTETVLAFDERDVSGLRLAAKSRSTSAVIFTSGSTGEKKAVCLSQYNFINNSLDTLHIGGYREDDVNILIVPVHHVFGLALIVTAVVAKHGIFVPKSVETDYVIDCMIKYNVTRLNGVPSLYLALAANTRAEEVKGLRCGLIGGAPCSAEQFRKIEQKLGVTLVPVYGMSECIGISCGDYRDSIENRCDSVGRIYSMNTLKIESDGEILIKSPAMAAGYLDGGSVADPEGWLHTGDLGYLDGAGFLHVSGRKKDIIIRNGNNISAAKIEAALLGLSYIEGAAAVAASDERAGEIPCAMVALKAGEKRTEEEILRDLTRFLTKIEMPVRISPTEKLPLTSTGKTDKEKIKKFFSESRKIK